MVTTEEVVSAVQKLDTGKSSGLDGIFAEHLLHHKGQNRSNRSDG